ncbi:MAG: hypothetical protein JWQ95_1105 [Sphaerisporangium sp.]|nr:hypothetical protein [Sphaerisporangium sp.]
MTEAGSPDTTLEQGGFAPEDEERVLKRSDEGRMLTGVCAGLGRYTGMDPVIFRVGFAALVVGSGIGIMLYVAAFLLMRSMNGGPGYVEQWSRRVFDTDTVMALLAAIFAFGLIINLAADGISTATVVVGTLLAIALLAAHARGVDLLALTKTLPERIKGKRGVRPVPEEWANGPFGAHPFSPPSSPFAAPPVPAFTAPSGSRLSAAPGSDPAGSATGTAVPADAGTPSASAADAPPVARPPHTGEVPGHADTPADAGPGSDTDMVADARPDKDTDMVPGAGLGAGPEYRRLSDLAREARGAPYETAGPSRGSGPLGSGSTRYGPARTGPGGFDSSGEPFAPHGPYRPYASSQPYEPHDWNYGKRAAKRPKRPKSFIGAITIFIAFVVGGIMVATQSSSSMFNLPVVGGVVLITIGAGLLVATWFGRGAGLVATGTIMSILLVAGSTVNGIPKKIGSYTWEPVDSSQPASGYSVGIGDGTLDLRSTKLVPGSRTRFDASISIGELKIIVPRTARVEVFGYTRLGDVKIEHTVLGGTDVQHNKVLEPDVTPPGTVAVIELHVKAGIGDVDVHRAA